MIWPFDATEPPSQSDTSQSLKNWNRDEFENDGPQITQKDLDQAAAAILKKTIIDTGLNEFNKEKAKNLETKYSKGPVGATKFHIWNVLQNAASYISPTAEQTLKERKHRSAMHSIANKLKEK